MQRDVLELLFESLPALQHAFGGEYPLSIRFLNDDTDIIIKATIHVPSTLDGEAALKRFDEHWWLKQCHRAQGLLVFDYETLE